MVKLDECDRCERFCEHPQNVCMAKAELVEEKVAVEAAELFKMLGDSTRVKILQALSRRELCVCDIAAVLSLGQSAVSHQLRLLRNARMVKFRKDGQMVWYSLRDGHVFHLLQQGIAHVSHCDDEGV